MRRETGFTLIELMLVVAIIGLLAAIAVPRFADIIIKARGASLRGKLGSIRSALELYVADNDGRYPQSAGFAFSLAPKYLESGTDRDSLRFPRCRVPGYTHIDPLDNYFVVGGTPSSSAKYSYVFPDSSRWVYHRYNNHPIHHPPIFVFVGCTHTDTRGVTWSQY